MPASRTCSECPKSLREKPPTAKTCGDACRQKRSKRLKRAKEKPEHLEQFADAVTHGAKDVLHETAKEVLLPIVRESITDDILIAINKMVRLTPRMIELIAIDMESEDPQIRQKAYTLMARYTLGNSSVAPQPDAPGGTTIEVNFALPRPGDADIPVQAVESDVVKPCMECAVEKPEREFADGSDRCVACNEALQARVRERFG